MANFKITSKNFTKSKRSQDHIASLFTDLLYRVKNTECDIKSVKRQ